MIYLTCECGSGLGVPGSFLGEPVRCEDCGRVLRLVAGQELENARGLRWELDVRAAPGPARRGERIILGGAAPITVGRDPRNHLVLTSGGVSTRHCRFNPTDDGGWAVEDLRSRHGVLVNGKRVTAQALHDGDVIDVGRYKFRYEPLGTPSPRPSPAAAQAGAHRHSAHTPGQSEAPPRTASTATTTTTVTELPAPPPDELEEPDETFVPPPTLTPMGPRCPSCRRSLAPGALICVDCGVDALTGRPLRTARALDEDLLYEDVRWWMWWVTWLPIPMGLFPVTTEAPGRHKPYVTWAIAAITIVASFACFFANVGSKWTDMPAGARFMLWSGDRDAAAALVQDALKELAEAEQAQQIDPAEAAEIRAAAQRGTLPFQPYQLITHALLHGDLFHLAGNLLFLIVLGSRVNAMIGNVLTAILYPALAVASGLAHHFIYRDQPAQSMIGASGAVMGMAGMYFVLMPAYRVHVAMWLCRIFTLIVHVAFVIVPVRGFWVVLFFIAFDVIATLLTADDMIAHWAHLGGFAAGAAVALLLLLTRVVKANGGDMISVVFGRYAWLLVGRPGRARRFA